jgi:hypothetical protein
MAAVNLPAAIAASVVVLTVVVLMWIAVLRPVLV